MIKSLQILICSSLFLIPGCIDKKEIEEQKTANEIITQCIKSSIGTGDSTKIAFKVFPDLPDVISKNEQQRLKQMNDSITKVMLAIDPFIVVSDTILSITNGVKVSVEGLLHEAILEGFDTSGYLGLNEIAYKHPDTQYIAQKTTVKVTSKEPWEKGKELYYHNPRFIAFFGYYKISYSDERKKAFVYGMTGINRGSSSGNLYFLNKINNEWKVVHKQTIW